MVLKKNLDFHEDLAGFTFDSKLDHKPIEIDLEDDDAYVEEDADTEAFYTARTQIIPLEESGSDLDLSLLLQREEDPSYPETNSLLSLVEYTQHELQTLVTELQEVAKDVMRSGFEGRTGTIRLDPNTAALFSLNALLYATTIMHTTNAYLTTQLSRMLHISIEVLRTGGVLRQ